MNFSFLLYFRKSCRVRPEMCFLFQVMPVRLSRHTTYFSYVTKASCRNGLTPAQHLSPLSSACLESRAGPMASAVLSCCDFSSPPVGLGKRPVGLSLDGRGRTVPCACDHWALETVSKLQLMFLMVGRSQEDAGKSCCEKHIS